MNDFEVHATFWEHLEELRKTFFLALIPIAIAMGACLFFYPSLISILENPLQKIHGSLEIQQLHHHRVHNPTASALTYVLPADSNGKTSSILIPAGETVDVTSLQPMHQLTVLSPIEGIMTTIKISFWGGLVISSPIWLLLLLRFVSPALQRPLVQLLPCFLILSIIFMTAGMAFAYYITLPLANSYLYAFNLEIGNNLWSLSNYLDYTVCLLLANGLAAEMALGLFFLVHCGILTPQMMANKRRHMIVLAFILGALLTPPDLLTQFLLAVPLIIFYEAAILYGKWILKKKSIQFLLSNKSKSLLNSFLNSENTVD